MTSDANFEGKGDFTKSVEPLAPENGQMVNNDLPTASNEGLTTEATPGPRAEIFANPFTAVFGAFTYQDHTYVKLTDFAEQSTASREAYEALRTYFLDIIVQYNLSPSFLQNTDPDKASKASDLYSGFMLLLNTAADHKLGFASNKAVIDPPADLKGIVVTPDYIDLYQHNPRLYTDVDMLQTWVVQCQEKARLLLEINANNQKMMTG